MPSTLDRLLRSVEHLERSYGQEPDLALAAAKRVQRVSRMLVQELASERDNATAQEAQANARQVHV